MKRDQQNQKPPRWARNLLKWYCAPHLLEEIEGDLNEEYNYQVKRAGVILARFDYIRSVLGFMKPFAIRRKKISIHHNSPSPMNMFNHYIIIASRNLVRQKTFSLLNIAGLALGMTCCLFILLWINDELSVDNFHRNGNRLFNAYETVTTNGVVSGSYNTPFQGRNDRVHMLLTDVQGTVPEVENVSFYATGYELPWGYAETFHVGDKTHKFEGSRASEDFLTLFSYPVIAGKAEKALKDISSIALSRKMAEVFFDSPENAIGKNIRYEDRIDFTVTAVFENVPSQSTLKFDFLINWESHVTRMAWASPHFLTTLMLKENVDIRQVEIKINRFIESHQDKNDPRKVNIGLQPYRDRYLAGNFINGRPEAGRMTYVKIFSGVSVFILLIACINFMNLATARSMKRAKEIGVRKVVGTSRISLIVQFLGESLLLSFFALLISLGLVHLLIPGFNTFTGKYILSPLSQPSILIVFFGIMLITGLVAGSYPALFLSSLRTVKILKGTLRFSKAALSFRKGLAVFQFVISIILLIVTIVISQQTSYVQNAHLGYNRENLLYMRVEGEFMGADRVRNYNKYMAFKQAALSMSGIAMVDRSSEAPHSMGFIVDENDGKVETNDGNAAINWEGKEKRSSVAFHPASVGFDFLNIMNLKVVEGRGFSKDVSTDSADAFLINEEAVRQMGMKDPIGKWISAWDKKGHIIGILKDYHTNSLREPIRPLIIDIKEHEGFGVFIIRTEPGKSKEALASLEKVYKDLNPNYPFTYQFVDQEYDKLYRIEQVITKLSNSSALLAIIISCIGLLGLAMFSAEQRTKEFGIRKVLGATVADVVSLLTKDFVKIVFIAFCIAAPLAGYFMHQWLQGFAYKIELSWWIFAVAGTVSLLIAFITVGTQAFQSATSNPVKSLRSE